MLVNGKRKEVGWGFLAEGSLDTVLLSLIPSLTPAGFWEPVTTCEHMAFAFQS